MMLTKEASIGNESAVPATIPSQARNHDATTIDDALSSDAQNAPKPTELRPKRHLKGYQLPILLRRVGISGAKLAGLAGYSPNWYYYNTTQRFATTSMEWHIVETIRKAMGERVFDLAYAELIENKLDPTVRITGLEASRMFDHLGWSYQTASRKLSISRSTLTRLVQKHYHGNREPFPLIHVVTIEQSLGRDAYLDVLAWVRTQEVR